MSQLIALPRSQVPALIQVAGARAAYRFLEFFTAQIRNPNTRRAYARDVDGVLACLKCAGAASIADAPGSATRLLAIF